MDETVRFREPTARREAQELSLLFDISRGLERNRDLRELVRPMLKELAERFALHRGTLTLLDWESGEINIEVAPGLSEKERDLGRFAVGEGVTGGIIAFAPKLNLRQGSTLTVKLSGGLAARPAYTAAWPAYTAAVAQPCVCGRPRTQP